MVITGAKEIAIQEWKTEKTQLTRERESLNGQYKPLDEELSRLLAVRHCAEITMKGEQKRTIEEQQLMPKGERIWPGRVSAPRVEFVHQQRGPCRALFALMRGFGNKRS